MFGHGQHAEYKMQCHKRPRPPCFKRLLVQRLGVGSSGSDVGITGSLVRAGSELEGGGGLEVGVAGMGVRRGVVLLEVEVSKLDKHYDGVGW